MGCGATALFCEFHSFYANHAGCVSSIVQPCGRHVQGHLEPAALRSQQERIVQSMQHAKHTLQRLRVILRVASLCRQHAHSDDLVNFCMAFCSNVARRGRSQPQPHSQAQAANRCELCGSATCAWFCRLQPCESPLHWAGIDIVYPTLMEHLPRLLGSQRTFKGAKVSVPDDHAKSQCLFLGPHCQCASRELRLARERDAACNVGGRKGSKLRQATSGNACNCKLRGKRDAGRRVNQSGCRSG